MTPKNVGFPLKTRIPKNTNVVVFTGDDTAQFAALFTRNKPRFATMDEVLTLRMAESNPEADIWHTGCTCDDREYFGLDKNNIPTIAVLHTVPDTLKLSAEPTISHELFLEILDGKYGKVDTVTYETVLAQDRAKESSYGYFTYDEAMKNELLFARLGEKAAEYITHHHNMVTKTGSYKVEKFIAINDDNGYWTDEKFRCASYENGVGLIVSLENVLNVTKGNTLALQSYVRIDGLVNASTSCEITTTRNLSGSWAVCNDKPIYYDGHIPFYSQGRYTAHLPILFIENKCRQKVDFSEIHRLIEQVDKVWYVLTPEFTPQFMMRSLHSLGQRTLHVSVIEWRARTSDRPTLEQIEKAMKQPWDFYRIISHKWGDMDDPIVDVIVEYFIGDAYTDRVIPSEEEIVSDYKLLGRIV